MFEGIFGKKPDIEEGIEDVEETPTPSDDNTVVEGTNNISSEELEEIADEVEKEEKEEGELPLAA